MSEKVENEIDLAPLLSGETSQEEKAIAIQKIQSAFNDICEANSEAIKAAKGANNLALAWKVKVEEQTSIIVDLSDTITNIFSLLSAKMDLIRGDAQLLKLMDELAKFSLNAKILKAREEMRRQ